MDDSVSRFQWHETGDTSAADLLRECGRKLTDRELWAKFQQRFHGRIFLYLMRALRYERIEEDVTSLVPDLAQEVYLRLVRRDGHVLRSFRGTTELAAMAFLGRLCVMVVSEHFESQKTLKRKARVISIDEARAKEERRDDTHRSSEFDAHSLSSILAWIDMERVIEADVDRKNAGRNALVFKLHYVDGLSTAEIANFPGFELTQKGVETVLARLRKRIQE